MKVQETKCPREELAAQQATMAATPEDARVQRSEGANKRGSAPTQVWQGRFADQQTKQKLSYLRRRHIVLVGEVQNLALGLRNGEQSNDEGPA
jgi:hypothetical protein